MRPFTFSLCGALLVCSASAIDVCRIFHCIEDSDSPALSVTLNVPLADRVKQTTIRIDLYESNRVCDPSRVEMYSQELPIDGNGVGSGDLLSVPRLPITAHWEFSCNTPKDGSTEHKLRFTIDAVDGEKVQEKTSFETRFRQTWPIIFTSVESDSFAEEPKFSKGTLHYVPETRNHGAHQDSEL